MAWLVDWFRDRQEKQRLRQWAMGVHDRLAGRVLTITGGENLAIKDDFALRFEVMILLVSYQLFRLHEQKDQDGQKRLAALWEVTFEGFEYSLRERGVNDIRIAARMRTLFQDATGRRNAYLAALEQDNEDALRAAIGRNVLNGAKAEDARIPPLLAAMKAVD